MPSASVKSDSSGSIDTRDPLEKLRVIIEKKIKNLDKRRNKLENYRKELTRGKQLKEDQQRAVQAFDSVVAFMNMCRELSAQISVLMVENAKVIKMQQKRQQEERTQHELEKIKQVLRVQDTLRRLQDEEVREDLLKGRRGAIPLKEEQLKQLDELRTLVSLPSEPDREPPTIDALKEKVGVAADNLNKLIDGRSKTTGISFREMKALVNQVCTGIYPKKERSASGDTQQAGSAEPPQAPTQAVRPPEELLAAGGGRLSGAAQAKEKRATKQQTPPKTSVVNGPPSEEKARPPPPSAAAPAPALPAYVAPPPAAAPALPAYVTPPPAAAPALPAYLTPPPAAAPAPALPAYVAPPTPVAIDLSELVTASSFNFLQESQVAGAAAVFVDPAVVSFGSVEPPPPTPAAPIQSETFVNSALAAATPVFETPSWAQDDVEGWGPTNGGGAWGDAKPPPPPAEDRRGGFRRGRGFFRGGRGGLGYGGYVRGRGPLNGGYRGRGGFVRGGRGRGGYQY